MSPPSQPSRSRYSFIPRWLEIGLCCQHRNRAGCATLLFPGGLRLVCDGVTSHLKGGAFKRWRKRPACDCVGSTLVELSRSEKSSESKSVSRMPQFSSSSGLILVCVASIAAEPVALLFKIVLRPSQPGRLRYSLKSCFDNHKRAACATL